MCTLRQLSQLPPSSPAPPEWEQQQQLWGKICHLLQTEDTGLREENMLRVSQKAEQCVTNIGTELSTLLRGYIYSDAPSKLPYPISTFYDVVNEHKSRFTEAFGEDTEIQQFWNTAIGDKPWGWCEEITSFNQNVIKYSRDKEVELEGRVDELTQQLQQLQATHQGHTQELEQELQRLSEAYKEAQQQLETQQTTNSTLLQQLQDLAMEKNRMEEKYKSELDVLSMSTFDSEKQQEAVDEQMSKIQQRVTDITSDNEKLLLRLQETRTLQMEVTELNNSVSVLRADKKEQQEQHDKQLALLQVQHTATETGIIQAQTEVCKQIEQQLVDAELHNTELLDASTRLEENNALLVKQVGELTSEHGQCSSRIRNLQRDHQELIKLNEQKHKTLITEWRERLQDVQHDLKERTNKAETSVAQLQRKLQQIENERNKIQNELTRKTHTLETDKTDSQKVWMELQLAKKDLNTKTGELKWHQSEKLKKDQLINKLKERNSLLTQKLSDTEKDRSVLQAKNEIYSNTGLDRHRVNGSRYNRTLSPAHKKARTSTLETENKYTRKKLVLDIPNLVKQK
jgi:chromosome segregation ATPase